MDEEMYKSVAGQLRKPHGEFAVKIGEKMNEGNVHINHYTLSAMPLTRGDDVLEIGMGNGFFVKDLFIVEPTIKYTGCDYSEIMVEEARKLNEAYTQNGAANFVCAGADKLPFKNESFHKIFTINTLYFWDDTALILSEISRVLKPRGQLTISIRPQSVMTHYPFSKFGFTMYTKKSLSDLLNNANFIITHILEKDEPAQDISGEAMKVETLLISAVKK